MADDAPRIGLEKAGKSQGSSSSPDGVAGGAGGAAAGGRTSPPSAAAELRGEAGGEPWKLGACYNVFDGEELLEYSIRSVRPTVSYVVVVFQEVSNFGQEADPAARKLLNALVAAGLVDEVVDFAPRTYDVKEKKRLVSPRATGADLGVNSPDLIGDQFFNELRKREIGRQKCLEQGCTHFMAMDTDEFYIQSELEHALRVVVEGNYECALCYMRYYFKSPVWELTPTDDRNMVPAIYTCREDYDFRLGCPYPFLIDPTRKLNRLTRLKVFERSELEMHHMAFVRNDVLRKVMNTSNRGNYDDIGAFARTFAAWRPGRPPVHPHPYFQALFKDCVVRENRFNVPFTETASGLVTISSEVAPDRGAGTRKKRRKKGKGKKA